MAVTETGKTSRKLERLYVNRNGEEVKRLSDQVATVVLRVADTGEDVRADLADIFPDGMPEPCAGLIAAAFGLNTVLGNETAGESDSVKMITDMRARWEGIRDNEWYSGREGGPRATLVLEAWKAYFVSQGSQVSDAAIEKMRAKIAAGEVTTKALLDDPGIKAVFDQQAAERALAVAKASAAKATGASAPSAFAPE